MDVSSITEPFRFSVDVANSMESGQVASAGGDSLLRETRQEIRRIVQEVATLSQSRISGDRYWGKFLSLVGTAIAANGGIIWQREANNWLARSHMGALDRRLLDIARTAELPGQESNCHQQMICEVGNSAGPVMVPAGADWNSSQPGNPSLDLAAVVPIAVDPDESVQWIIELFLPVGGGPATQRGYLRFIAQMADLAAEYLRSERLRLLRSQLDHQERIQRLLAKLAQQESYELFAQTMVDELALTLRAERVSFVEQRKGKYRVEAVSGVESLDDYSATIRAIVECASDAPCQMGWFDAVHVDNESSVEGNDIISPTGALVLRGIAVFDTIGSRRLVVEDRPGEASGTDLPIRWEMLLAQIDAVGRGIAYKRSRVSQFFSSAKATRVHWTRRMAVPLGIAAAIVMAMLFPFPLTVAVEGRLQPLESQTIYAPHDGIVTEILVEHGAVVKTGDPVLQLVDFSLNRNIATLEGKRAVIEQRIQELKRQRSKQVSKDPEDAESLLLDIRTSEEELVGTSAELAIMVVTRENMLLRSQCDGIVDAWQIRQRLKDRPVPRGQSLLRIVPPEGSWIVEADVPQNRLEHVIEANSVAPVNAKVVVHAFPDLSLQGQFLDMGPLIQRRDQSEPQGVVLFSVDANSLPAKQSGAPVKLSINCGKKPLAYIACQDLVRMMSGTASLYW